MHLGTGAQLAYGGANQFGEGPVKNIKFGILLFGVLGIVGAFLPFMAGVSLFDMKGVPGAAGQVYLTMGVFVVGVVIGVLALKRLARWHGIVGALVFALGVVKNRGNMDGAIGAKLMLVAALGGLVCCIIAAVKPEA